MQNRATFILTLVVVLILISGGVFGKYSGGTGEPNDPYQISDVNDVMLLAADTNDCNKCFVLITDVNMEGQIFTTAIIAADTSSSSGFQGTSFTGIFDGNDQNIFNFTINGGSNSYLGLFGKINVGGSIKNVGLETAIINGPNNGSTYVGSLAGYNSGNINECYSDDSVNGFYGVGGLVGYNDGNVSDCYSTGVASTVDQFVGGLIGNNNGSISNCYSTGSVEGSGDNISGGLVGYNGGSIDNCYSKGAVYSDSLSGYYFGGLVGYNVGSVSNCYSTGAVSGYRIGGFAGFNNNGSITNCYSTGLVSCSSPYGTAGGLVGINNSVITGSFWDTETSGKTNSAGGTGKTTAEMKTLSTFTSAGWDFVEAWGIGNGQTYPYLKPFNGINPADINYSGTVDFIDFAIMAANWLDGVEL